MRCKEEGRAETILFGLSGHGHFDLSAYEAHLSGTLRDEAYSQAGLDAALAALPTVPALADA